MSRDEKLALEESLSELTNNCGDNLGRDGEYLSEQIDKISELVQKFKIQDEK